MAGLSRLDKKFVGETEQAFLAEVEKLCDIEFVAYQVGGEVFYATKLPGKPVIIYTRPQPCTDAPLACFYWSDPELFDNVVSRIREGTGEVEICIL